MLILPHRIGGNGEKNKQKNPPKKTVPLSERLARDERRESRSGEGLHDNAAPRQRERGLNNQRQMWGRKGKAEVFRIPICSLRGKKVER